MAALTGPGDFGQHGIEAVPSGYSFPIGAGAVLEVGGMVVLDSTGAVVEATAAGLDSVVVGIVSSPTFSDYLNNTGGPRGGVNGVGQIWVNQGVIDRLSGAGADAIGAANVGQPCYVIDDQTVGLTQGVGANRPLAGKVVGIDPVTGQVQVLMGFIGQAKAGQDIELIATAALAQGRIVTLDIANPGQVIACVLGITPLGVCQNSPAAGQFAQIRYAGVGVVKTAGAQAIGDLLESTAAGVSKVLVGLSDASGAPGGALVGTALTAVGGAGLIQALITPGGAVAGTPA